jgi:hypothetical protein
VSLIVADLRDLFNPHGKPARRHPRIYGLYAEAETVEREVLDAQRRILGTEQRSVVDDDALVGALFDCYP